MFLPKKRPAAQLVAAVILSSVAVVALAMGKRPAVDEEGIASRIQPVGRVELAGASTNATSAPRKGEEIFKTACAACHESGAAGAPKVGDKAAWAPRLGQGLDGLVKSAIAGKNAMPPKGGANVTDLELTRAIVFMANKSGASFKEPVEKK